MFDDPPVRHWVAESSRKTNQLDQDSRRRLHSHREIVPTRWREAGTTFDVCERTKCWIGIELE
jgi:hypothetical protein